MLGLERTLTHQVLPPGQGGWHSYSSEHVLTATVPRKGLLPAIKGSQPFLACCKYFAASNYSLFQSSTLQKNWLFPRQGIQLGIPTPPASFWSSSGVLQPPRDHDQQPDCPSGSWLWPQALPKKEKHKQQPQEELKRRVLLTLKCYKSFQLK